MVIFEGFLHFYPQSSTLVLDKPIQSIFTFNSLEGLRDMKPSSLLLVEFCVVRSVRSKRARNGLFSILNDEQMSVHGPGLSSSRNFLRVFC